MKRLTSSDPLTQNQLDTTAERLQHDKKILEGTKDFTDRVMPEDIFRYHFLPFWRGRDTVESKDKLFQIWLDAAGGVFGCIKVVDANGKTLGISPSVSPPNLLDPTRRRVDTQQVLETAARTQVPQLAQATMTVGLIRRFEEQTANLGQAQKEHLELWDQFLDIFEPRGQVTEANATTAPVDSDDGFE